MSPASETLRFSLKVPVGIQYLSRGYKPKQISLRIFVTSIRYGNQSTVLADPSDDVKVLGIVSEDKKRLGILVNKRRIVVLSISFHEFFFLFFFFPSFED